LKKTSIRATTKQTHSTYFAPSSLGAANTTTFAILPFEDMVSSVESGIDAMKNEGQKVSERSERELRKTRILAMKKARNGYRHYGYIHY